MLLASKVFKIDPKSNMDWKVTSFGRDCSQFSYLDIIGELDGLVSPVLQHNQFNYRPLSVDWMHRKLHPNCLFIHPRFRGKSTGPAQPTFKHAGLLGGTLTACVVKPLAGDTLEIGHDTAGSRALHWASSEVVSHGRWWRPGNARQMAHLIKGRFQGRFHDEGMRVPAVAVPSSLKLEQNIERQIT